MESSHHRVSRFPKASKWDRKIAASIARCANILAGKVWVWITWGHGGQLLELVCSVRTTNASPQQLARVHEETHLCGEAVKGGVIGMVARMGSSEGSGRGLGAPSTTGGGRVFKSIYR